jgi:hypothetical protein
VLILCSESISTLIKVGSVMNIASITLSVQRRDAECEQFVYCPAAHPRTPLALLMAGCGVGNYYGAKSTAPLSHSHQMLNWPLKDARTLGRLEMHAQFRFMKCFENLASSNHFAS